MVEDDGAEVTTVVVGNEVFSGVGALQAPCSDALVLQQGLVQGKQHLQGETDSYFLLLLFSTLCCRGICHEAVELV